MRPISNNVMVRRMWRGGPPREWSQMRVRGSMAPYADGGFVDRYVCEQCGDPQEDGVWQTKQGWVCTYCKNQGLSSEKSSLVQNAPLRVG